MTTRFLFLSVLMGAMPLTMAAQDDDLYFTPKKSSKDAPVKIDRDVYDRPAYYCGSPRNVDEYNRRGKLKSYYQKIGTDSLGNDVIEFHEGDGTYGTADLDSTITIYPGSERYYDETQTSPTLAVWDDLTTSIGIRLSTATMVLHIGAVTMAGTIHGTDHGTDHITPDGTADGTTRGSMVTTDGDIPITDGAADGMVRHGTMLTKVLPAHATTRTVADASMATAARSDRRANAQALTATETTTAHAMASVSAVLLSKTTTTVTRTSSPHSARLTTTTKADSAAIAVASEAEADSAAVAAASVAAEDLAAAVAVAEDSAVADKQSDHILNT